MKCSSTDAANQCRREEGHSGRHIDSVTGMRWGKIPVPIFIEEEPRLTEVAIAEWHDSKWGDKDDRVVTAKLGEECGEVQGAFIKIAEGRRTLADAADEIGDVLIVLSTLAGRHGWTLEQLRADRYATVSKR
jgi:NTP pyrophosphatase (non-canonical NTP hydrolase)